MHKVPIWDFLKVDRLEYIAIPKDQNIYAVKKYVYAMKNLDTGLNDEFIISSCKLLFLLFFASSSSYSVATFENFNRGQCFTISTSAWREWYTVLTSLNKLEKGKFLFICLAQIMNSSLFQKSNVMYLSKEATSQDSSLKTQLLLSTGDKKNWDRKYGIRQVFLEIRVLTLQLINSIFQKIPWFT